MEHVIRLRSTLALKGAMQRLAGQYQAMAATRIDADFAPTLGLLERLRQGETADVVILTKEGLNELVAEGALGLAFPETLFARHLTVFLIFCVGLVFLYRTLARRHGSWAAGLVGGAFMVLSPRLFADAFYNSKDIPFLAANVTKFMEAARKRPEIANVTTTFLPSVPQLYVNVDRDRALKEGVELSEVYKTLQAFMGGYFIDYFNRFGRQWQVYIQAEGEYRTRAENLGLFYVRNHDGEAVPLAALTSAKSISGPEFTMRYNLYRSAQINGSAAPGGVGTGTLRPFRSCVQYNGWWIARRRCFRPRAQYANDPQSWHHSQFKGGSASRPMCCQACW